MTQAETTPGTEPTNGVETPRKKRNFGDLTVMYVETTEDNEEKFSVVGDQPDKYKTLGDAERWLRDHAEDGTVYALVRIVKRVTTVAVTERKVHLKTVE